MSAQAIAICNTPLKTSMKLMLFCLSAISDRHGEAAITHSRLAKLVGLKSDRQVFRIITELRYGGFVTRVKRGQRGNIYRLTIGAGQT